MKWFQSSTLGRSGNSSTKVDPENERVSDAQLASTCVTAIVGSGSARLILADGSTVDVPDEVIERSRLLAELVRAADVTSPVVVGARAHLHAWFQYQLLTNDARESCHWLRVLRSLLVRLRSWSHLDLPPQHRSLE